MTITLALILCAVTYAIYEIMAFYLRRSMRSFGTAERVWSKLTHAAHALLEQDISENLARTVLASVSMAGCGCFVRGVLMVHYLPKFLLPTAIDRGNETAAGFEDMDALDKNQRAQLDELFTLVFVYDSFRNPLQGWLFRRMLKSYLNIELSVVDRLEQKLAAFSALTRNKPKVLRAH